MAYRVSVTQAAEHDLDEIVSYFVKKLCNVHAAESLLEEFLKEKDNISENPYMYPFSNNLRLQSENYHRFLFKNNYIALYLIDDSKKEVVIMRIFYAKRDYSNLI